MGKLLEELAEQVVATTTRCPVALMMRDMVPSDRDEMQEALDSSYSAVLLGKVLRNRGHVMSDRAIQNHRRKSCSCRS